MFTGIIEEVGTLIRFENGGSSAKIASLAGLVVSDLKIGDSVAVNGACLTVINIQDRCFEVDVMNETYHRTTLGKLKPNSKVNLERAMPANGRFGGHIVSGHIDGTGHIISIREDDNAIWFEIKTSPEVMHYIVEKGSVAIDGISLTVAKVTEETFSVSIIPHTVKETVLGRRKIGDEVNLENDLIGKYVEHFLIGKKESQPKSSLTVEFLRSNGF